MSPATRRPVIRSRLVLLGALTALVFAGATLTACGQKGQLYLPSQKKSKVPATQQPQDTQPPPAQPESSTSPAAS
ncbi:MAG TPA: lipoprotein [Steroidobacteraceae bacterium]|jgi:predicted small lipoprotein YifL|nr:lipoprotein [Steroidobacteraceae bacterium]